MNALEDLLKLPWISALGETLLHSVWQALIIISVVVMLLSIIPSRFSNGRYAVAVTGLVLILCCSLGTYVHLITDSHAPVMAFTAQVQDDSWVADYPAFSSAGSYFETANNFIQQRMPSFILLWMFGTILFSLRILTGLHYVQKLKRESVWVENSMVQRFEELAKQLKIKRLVSIAESKAIQAPVIIGYLKPVMLIPVGMISSLSTEQLETIFLHELMHIRRKDYLINLFQSWLEAIYFFNPFVWIISAIIKREREHCCDDAVVHHYGNTKAYVHALATLAELRLTKAGLCLGLAENKNQLLNRIKRLMERSVKTYSSRERIIPALLLVIGLICASWISTQNQKKPLPNTHNQSVVSDTTKKEKKHKLSKKEKAARAEKNNLKKTEESGASSETSHDLDVLVPPPPVPGVDVGDIDLPLDLDVEAMIPPFPDMHSMFENFDAPGLAWPNEKDWQKFSEEFEATFKNRFEDFYVEHEKDIEQMMKEAHEKIGKKFDHDWELRMEDFAKGQEDWAKANAQQWEQASKRMAERHEALAKKSKDEIQRIKERHALHQQQFEKNREQFEESMKAFEEKNKRFEAELKSELLKDGYLNADEDLKNMHWHNGEIEINGKKIKPEHEKKYNELHSKYFQRDYARFN